MMVNCPIQRPMLLQSSASCKAIQFGMCLPERVVRFTCSGPWAINKDTSEAKPRKTSLQKGMLIEFQKDSGRTLLGVTQNQEGKRNWSVIDQNAETCIVRPNQINLIIPGSDNYRLEDVNQLLNEVEQLQDPTLLEMAWEEVLLKEKTVDIEELALTLYGTAGPNECYSAHRLISSYPLYFKCKDGGYFPKYEPRSPSQVKDLQIQKMQEEKAHQQLMQFVNYVKSSIQLPVGERPTQDYWNAKESFKPYLDSLREYALETCKSSDIRNTSIQVLEKLNMNKTSASATNLLVQMGYFRMHENLYLLKLDIPIDFSTVVISEAESIKNEPLRVLDMENRIDLTSLRVYTIDCEDPDEIDDGLSAVQLPDGRLKVWIHIADPTRWIRWNSILQKEASKRCTSVYLPTMTIPMFPKDLSVDLMSLRQGQYCSAVSVSVTLSDDGSIAESNIENSTVLPTYKMSYEAASELLSLGLDEEVDLSLLYKAALLRKKWRLANGALDSFLPSVNVTVKDEHAANPKITISVEDQSNPSTVLVTEMMLLCGEVIASFGFERGLSLPYRGQVVNEVAKAILQSIPEGPARAMATIRCMQPAETSFRKPLEHACLGLPGYVQFSSPLRRYSDLLVHYQVKASLRGEDPPIPLELLETSIATVNSKSKILKKLRTDTERYWILEYLRREPSDRKYRAYLLRFEKDDSATILLSEVGILNSLYLHTRRKEGDEFFVRVVDSQPRKNLLSLKEA